MFSGRSGFFVLDRVEWPVWPALPRGSWFRPRGLGGQKVACVRGPRPVVNRRCQPVCHGQPVGRCSTSRRAEEAIRAGTAIADNEVLLRVHAAGLDRGTWHLMTGRPYLGRLAFGLRRPRNPVPGLDVVGTVVAVGSAVTRFSAGDEVFGFGKGSFAEYAVARADKLASTTPATTSPTVPTATT